MNTELHIYPARMAPQYIKRGFVCEVMTNGKFVRLAQAETDIEAIHAAAPNEHTATRKYIRCRPSMLAQMEADAAAQDAANDI